MDRDLILSSYSPPKTEIFSFRDKYRDYALIIGVLNEGQKISHQIELLQPYREYVDIIIADGGSSDGATSKEAIKEKVSALLINKDEKRGLSVQYRGAIHYAMSLGYKGVIMMDGNGKDSVSSITKFIEKLQDGFDFIQGSRFTKGGYHENTPFDRILGIKFVFNPLMWLGSGFLYTDAMNGYKACSSSFILHPQVQPFRNIFIRYNLQYYFNYIAPKLKLKITEIPVSRIYIEEIVHSKIIGLKPKIKIIIELINTITGKYNVKM